MVHIIERGGERDRESIPLATRMGTHIPNERRQERNPQSLQSAVDIHTLRPSVRLRSATAVYNCVGLVFSSRRAWIEPEHIPMILEEDGYYKVDDEGKIMPGDLVLYQNNSGEISHIGIVLERSPNVKTASWKIVVVSQWGGDGEYIHEIDDVLDCLGRPSEYWSERRELR